MKNFILCLGLGIIFSTPLYAQTSTTEYNALVSKAEALYKKKEYLEAGKAYAAAFERRGYRGAPNDWYNASRAWAMAKMPDSAFSCLQRIANKTYLDDPDKVTNDADLASLHSDKRWQPLLSVIFKNKENKLPGGFFRAGSRPGSYLMSVDKGAGKDKNDVITIKSTEDPIKGFGTAMNNFPPEKYLGKRVRMSGYLKTSDVESWAAFWMRVDGDNEQNSLAFDNMKSGKTDRSVTGTTDWERYEIVLDVPSKATNIAYGALIGGTGQIWFDKVEFEIVDNKTETTGQD